MHFDEREEGGYRIYAGALEATQATGYVAAAVISRRAVTGQREAWRDISMSGGHVWRSPDDALRYAIARATEVIRTEPERLAC
jgi:hypothetical protein